MVRRRLRVGLVGLAASAWCLAVFSVSPRAQSAPTAIAAHESVAFLTSDNCLACHNGMMASSGEDVSIGAAWRASMMANSARDPYWQASVRRESIDHPTAREAIEHECSICHMPMAHTVAAAEGRAPEIFRLLPGRGSSDEHRLAADGVSCSLCHQISAERLGTPESFVGRYVIARGPTPDAGTVRDRSRTHGPYAIGDRRRAGRGRTRAPVGVVRHLSHALYAGDRP